MATTQQSIDVNVPVRTAYNQWTQFESFPQFMEGVESVQQFDDKHLHWRAKVGGKVQEWDAEITEQIPDQKIAWRSISGVPNGGVVTFNYLGPNETRVLLSIDYDPQGVAESAGAALGFMDRRVKSDLERFKTFIESRGQETGAWRGTIEDHPELGNQS
ncbi:MAG: SRPBCC family protein [Ktedonobacterales bacterium]